MSRRRGHGVRWLRYGCPFRWCRWRVWVATSLDGRGRLADHVRDAHALAERPPE